MSILKQVIQQYGNPETLEGLTDRTDKRASVGFVSEWLEGFEKNLADVTPEEVSVAMEMVAITRMRLRGEVPDHYTATTECKGCGPVPIFEGLPNTIRGCPWCFNRLKGLPIPRNTQRGT